MMLMITITDDNCTVTDDNFTVIALSYWYDVFPHFVISNLSVLELEVHQRIP